MSIQKNNPIYKIKDFKSLWIIAERQNNPRQSFDLEVGTKWKKFCRQCCQVFIFK